MKEALIEVLRGIAERDYSQEICKFCGRMAVDCEKCPFDSSKNLKAIIEELEATQ